MSTAEYIQHFKKEVPLLGVLVSIGCTAALAKQANKKLQPWVDSKLG